MEKTKRRHQFLVAGVLAAATVLVAAQSSATTTRAATLEELTDRADLIVMGTVVSSTTVMDRTKPDAMPHTVTVLAVTDWLKGKSPRSIVHIVEVGGRVGRAEMRAVGVPDYHKGDEVLVFLEKEPGSAELATLGLEQGRFHIRRGVRPELSSAWRDLSSLALVDWKAGAMARREGKSEVYNLAQLRDFVLARVGTTP